ncbi:MAG: threonine synthase [Candidatus Melainabacteria bacterium HGW-Melainabacteria-1]|nr:MAG: threonine synthase [Candidatus Melainabacteria bacterium HGW-Melainabacteria-1]
MWQGLIRTYQEYLPVDENTPVITLHEGNTPLIPAPWLSERTGAKVWLKYEGLNPTGSFKDRGMTMAISKAAEAGSKAVMCASTGNTSASMAAYAARAGMQGFILVPDGYVALGKLSQAIAHGGKVLPIQGNFDVALELVREICASYPVTLVNSVNPYRIEGQQTAAFEVCDQLGFAPDILSIPVGNAGNITAYWKGFKAYHAVGKADQLPRMWGFQAAGAAPIVHKRRFENPETVATAIRIGNPASWQYADAALAESQGHIDEVTDDQILAAYALLSTKEGVFCEPASAASVAGLLKQHEAGALKPGTRVVCVLTGHGLKDPDRAIAYHTGGAAPQALKPDLGLLIEAMGL